MEQLSHPNVISLKAHGLGSAKVNQSHLYFIFMEVASGGELFDQVINAGATPMLETTARGFFLQLLRGLAYVHSVGVVHRDLKLENVLLTKDKIVKIIDFGLSHVYSRHPDGKIINDTPLKEVCGSKSYAAPEVLSNQGYDGFTADVWSLGVCLFCLLSGFFPVDEASSNDWRFDKLRRAQQGGRSSTAVIYGWYKRSTSFLSPQVLNLLDGMLMIDPTQRLSIEQILAHPWVTGTHGTHEGATGVVEQGIYDAHLEVEDDAPTYRSLSVSGPVEDDATYDDGDGPICRDMSDLDDEQPALELPCLMRQEAFGRRKSYARIF